MAKWRAANQQREQFEISFNKFDKDLACDIVNRYWNSNNQWPKDDAKRQIAYWDTRAGTYEGREKVRAYYNRYANGEFSDLITEAEECFYDGFYCSF